MSTPTVGPFSVLPRGWEGLGWWGDGGTTLPPQTGKLEGWVAYGSTRGLLGLYLLFLKKG